MNFYLVVIYGYTLIAVLLIYFINRDRTKPELFFGKHRNLSWALIGVLLLGIVAGIDARWVEINLLSSTKKSITVSGLKRPLTIAFLSDIHAGEHKKTAWVEKVAKKIETINPDLVLFGGDFIVNFGSTVDESQYLEPLRQLVGKFPMYYVVGNHEYGVGIILKTGQREYHGDHSQEVMSRMKAIGIPLLRNELVCPEIKGEKICLYGVDEVWSGKMSFAPLAAWDKKTPLVLLAHNPDALLYWPEEIRYPDLELAGHTHGGQIRLPFIGPLGEADVRLGKNYYKGLNYWNGVAVFTTVGVSESGGPIRFLNPPEIAVITLTPSPP